MEEPCSLANGFWDLPGLGRSEQPRVAGRARGRHSAGLCFPTSCTWASRRGLPHGALWAGPLGTPPGTARAYFIWNRLLVPRWSMSWHRPAVTMAKASRSV